MAAVVYTFGQVVQPMLTESIDGGHAAWQLRDTNGNGDAIIGTSNIADGDWHHIVNIRDDAAGKNYLYVDGFKEGEYTHNYTAGFNSATAPINIGWLNLSAGYYYTGTVDEVALYSRALGESEIIDHYNSGAGKKYCEIEDSSPVITSTPVEQGTMGVPYSYDVAASGNPAPTFSLTTFPSGMMIDANSGLITWDSPTTGDHDVTVTATNSVGTDTQSYTLVITEAPACPTDMIAYLKLDETSGSTFDDYYDGHDASCSTGHCPGFGTGILNGALDFNGTNQWITVPDHADLDWGKDDSFSIEVWAKLTNCDSRNKVMVGRDNRPGGEHWWLGCDESSKTANFNLLDTSDGGIAIQGTTLINDNAWHHIVAVRDNSNDQNRLYVDGQLEDSGSHNYTAGFNATTTLGIGYMAYTGTPDYYYDGLLDEVALYSKALSEAEILDHYNNGAGKSYCEMQPTAPVIISTPALNGWVGQLYSYDVDASGFPAATFSLLTSPGDMTIDPASGLIEWTPSAEGDFDVTVQAANSEGSDTQSYTIDVSQAGTCDIPVAIMPLGDSITEGNASGVGDDHYKLAYRKDLWDMLNASGHYVDFVGTLSHGDYYPSFDADHEGHGGWTDDQIGVNIYNWLDINPADIILLHIGTNGLESDPSDVEVILDEIDRWETDNSRPITVVLARIINRLNFSSSTTTAYNNNVAAMAEDRVTNASNDAYPDDIIVVDMENGAGINYAAYTSGGDMWDNLHPYSSGYEKMAQVWYDVLHPMLPVCSAVPNCPQDIESYWQLDETSSGTYADTYDNNIGLCSGAECPTPTTGIINGGQLFSRSATGTKVNVLKDTAFDWGKDDSFTIEYWMKGIPGDTCSGSTVNDNEVIVGRDDASSNLHFWTGCAAYVDGAEDGGYAAWRLHDINGNGDGITGTTNIADGSWHHIVAIRDNVANMNYLYVDGVKEGQLPYDYTTGFTSPTEPLNIGWLNLSAGFYYSGTVDEVAIYSRALEQAEIVDHYNSGAGTNYCQFGATAPLITSTPVLDAVVQQPYIYDVNASGYPVPTFALTQNPSGMTIDPNSGLIEWTPTVSGDYDVTVEATNTEGSDTQSFTIHVGVMPICPANMLSYWELDETSGTDFADTYDGNDAACSGANCPAFSTGLLNGGLDFDGTQQYITVDDDTSLDWAATDSFTIELWAKPDPCTTKNKVMIGRDDYVSSSDHTHWWLGCKASSTPSSRVAAWNMLDRTSSGIALYGTTQLDDGNWHHLVAVRDESTNTNLLYVDGVLEDSDTYNYLANFDATTTLGIGYMAYNHTPDYYYDGELDEIALYKRALTAAEIVDHYNSGSGKKLCQSGEIAPVIETLPIEQGTEGTPYSYDVDASGTAPITYSLTTAPTGMTIDPNSGLIEWSSPVLGDHAVSILAENSAGSDTQDYTLSITAVPVCPTDIIAYYPLDESSGTTYTDSIAANDAVCSGDGCPAPAAGIVNNAQSFDGVDDNISAPDIDSMEWTADSSFTVELWAQMDPGDSCDGNDVMIGRDGSGNLHWWVGCLNGSNYVNFGLRDNSGVYQGTPGDTALNDGNWHHIVAIRNAATDQNHLYVDGELQNTITYDYTSGFAGTAPLSIGSLNSDYRFNGLLDEVAIYDKALAEGEILMHYNQGAGRNYCQAVAPEIVSNPITNTVVGALYNYDVQATGNPAPTYALNTFPDGMTINPTTGLIEWTPDASQIGDHPVQVQASNGIGTADTQDFTVTVQDTPPCPDGITSFFHLDEESSPYLDPVRGLEGTCTNCPDSTAGLVGNAQQFNGTNDEVNITPDSSFDWGKDDSFSVEFWVWKATACTGNEVIVGRDDSGSNLHIWIGCNSNGTANFQLRDTTGAGLAIASSAVLNNSQWHHVAAVRDNATDTNTIYLDGVPASASFDYQNGFESATASMNVGFLNLSPNYRFDGLLDELIFYNQALTPAQVSDHFNNPQQLSTCSIAPSIYSQPVTTAFVGSAYTYDVQATGIPAPQYSLDEGPAGMTIDANSGLVEWNNPIEGVYPVTVSATNSKGSDTQAYDLYATRAPVCTDGITSYWNLNEDAGPTYADIVSGLDATCTNCPDPATGILENGQQFNGTSDEVAVAPDSSFNWGAGDSFSIEYWVWKATPCDGNEVMIGRDDSSSSLHMWIGCLTDGKAFFQLKDKVNAGGGVTHTAVLNNSTWHHVVAVRDAATNTNTIYVDNVPVSSAFTYSGGFDSTSANLDIGYLNLGGRYRFDGILDEIALYNQALTPAQISDHYNSGAGKKYCNSYPLVHNPGEQTNLEGDSVSLQILAEDPDDDTLVYSAVGLPTDLNIAADTGLISGTLGLEQAGIYTVTVTASDGDLEGEAIFTWTVNNLNQAPTADNDDYVVDQGGTLNLAAPGVLDGDTDPDLDPLTVDLTSVTGPTHASAFNINTDGSFSYTHDDSENFSDSFTYEATDGSLNSNTATVNISINPVNHPPVLATIGDLYLTEGDTLSVPVSATDQDTSDTLTFVDTDTPAFATFTDHGDRSATLALAPQTGDAGDYQMTVTVSDSGSPALDDFETFWIHVSEPLPPVLSLTKTANPTEILEGETVEYTYEILNTGTEPIHDITLTDDKLGDIPLPGGRVSDGLLALYTFDEGSGSTVHDVSGVGTPLDLTIANTGAVSWLPSGGLTFNSATIACLSWARLQDLFRRHRQQRYHGRGLGPTQQPDPLRPGPHRHPLHRSVLPQLHHGSGRRQLQLPSPHHQHRPQRTQP